MNLRLEYLDPETLTANPNNWRCHPVKQTAALRDIIDEVGWAGALLYNETTGHLIDGHARKEIATGEKVPVLIGQWTEEQEKLILTTLDPLAAMATTDQGKLDELLSELSVNSLAVQQLLESMSVPDIPDFSPVDASGQPRLDRKKECVCPACGHTWEAE